VGTTSVCPAWEQTAIVQAKGIVGKPAIDFLFMGAERTSRGDGTCKFC